MGGSFKHTSAQMSCENLKKMQICQDTTTKYWKFWSMASSIGLLKRSVFLIGLYLKDLSIC